MRRDITVVRFHPALRMASLLLMAFGVKVVQNALTLPETLDGGSLQLPPLVVALSFFIGVSLLTLYVFTFKQEWDYNGVKYRQWLRTRELDRATVERISVRRGVLASRWVSYEFDSFDVRGPKGSSLHLNLDFLMDGCGRAKTILNQWVLLRPGLLQDGEVNEFLACRPGRLVPVRTA